MVLGIQQWTHHHHQQEHNTVPNFKELKHAENRAGKSPTAKESPARLAVYLGAESGSKSLCDQSLFFSLIALYRRKNKVQEGEEVVCPKSGSWWLRWHLNPCSLGSPFHHTASSKVPKLQVRRNRWFQWQMVSWCVNNQKRQPQPILSAETLCPRLSLTRECS